MPVSKYRKKPVVVEALQLRWDDWSEMCDHANVGKLEDGKAQGTFLNDDMHPTLDWTEVLGLLIPTLEGLMIACENDYVIRGIQDELYSCKPDIFEATYELVDEYPNE